VIWEAIERDAEFGRLVFQNVLGPGAQSTSGLERSLDETQLANLYAWLVSHYPDNQVLGVLGAQWVSPESRVRRWSLTILDELVARGTAEACDVIRSMVQDQPDDRWLKFKLREAERNTRTRTWSPSSPEDVLALARDLSLRRVENGTQLLEVLVESLARLEQKLQGETPAAIDIWNEVARGKFRPRDENSLSDYVKRHLEADLRDRLVIVNREVEIRRSLGPGSGERTDLHVVMTAPIAGRKPSIKFV